MIDSIFNFDDFRTKKSKYLYFLTDFNGNTKIGRGNDPVKRAVEITTISNKLVFPVLIGCPKIDSNIIESKLHKIFHEKRIGILKSKTEWFSIETYKSIILSLPFLMEYFNHCIVYNPDEYRYIPLFQGMIELGITPAEINE